MSAVEAKKLGEKYILLDLIGTGGMAEVYRGKLLGDKGFQKPIVIKKLLPHVAQDKEMVQLFIGEARLAALLQHENIAATYDFGELNNNFFLAMEYLFGKDLYTVMQRAKEHKSPLEVRHALIIASKICEGMDYVHSLKDLQNNPLNIIHRDLTPQNIFLTYDGKVKVIDFGVAKAEMLDTKTRAGVVKGKVSYMSPEQISGAVVDSRSDIFSIGILLYEMISQRRMYDGDTAALIRKSITVEYEHLETIIQDLPPQLYAILDKTLTSNLESRYQSCAEMQEDIENLLFSMSERPDSRLLKEYMQNLFADEHESEQRTMVSAMESVVASPDGETTYPASDKTILYDFISDDDGRKKSFIHAIHGKWQDNKRGYSLIASICLVALIAFLLPAFLKKDTPTDISSPVGQEVIAHTETPFRQAIVRQRRQQVEKVLTEDDEENKRRQEQDREAEKRRQEQIKKDQERQLEAEKRKQERLREEKKVLQQIENRYVDRVGKDLAEHRYSWAEGYVKAGLSVYPDNQVLQRLLERVASEKQILIADLYKKAEERLNANWLTNPADDSALLYYNKIKEVNPYSVQAQAGLRKIADRYASMADLAYRKFDFRTAEEYVKRGLTVVPDHDRLLTLKRDFPRSKPEVFAKGVEKNAEFYIKGVEKNAEFFLKKIEKNIEGLFSD